MIKPINTLAVNHLFLTFLWITFVKTIRMYKLNVLIPLLKFWTHPKTDGGLDSSAVITRIPVLAFHGRLFFRNLLLPPCLGATTAGFAC